MKWESIGKKGNKHYHLRTKQVVELKPVVAKRLKIIAKEYRGKFSEYGRFVIYQNWGNYYSLYWQSTGSNGTEILVVPQGKKHQGYFTT